MILEFAADLIGLTARGSLVEGAVSEWFLVDMDEDSFSSECTSIYSEILDASLDSTGSIDSLTSDCINDSGDSATDDKVQLQQDT